MPSKQEDFDVTAKPTSDLNARLIGHIVLKGWQAGSILGLGLVGPVQFYRAGSPAGSAFRFLAASAAYTGLGLASASGVLAVVKTSNMDRPGLEDRVYRLYYSDSQNRTDLFGAAGAALGAAAAAAFAKPRSPLILFGGAAVGTALGIGAHMASKPAEQAKGNQMVEEMTRA